MHTLLRIEQHNLYVFSLGNDRIRGCFMPSVFRIRRNAVLIAESAANENKEERSASRLTRGRNFISFHDTLPSAAKVIYSTGRQWKKPMMSTTSNEYTPRWEMPLSYHVNSGSRACDFLSRINHI